MGRYSWCDTLIEIVRFLPKYDQITYLVLVAKSLYFGRSDVVQRGQRGMDVQCLKCEQNPDGRGNRVLFEQINDAVNLIHF